MMIDFCMTCGKYDTVMFAYKDLQVCENCLEELSKQNPDIPPKQDQNEKKADKMA